MPSIWQQDVFSACLRFTPNEIEAEILFNNIKGTQAYWKCRELYICSETRDKAFEMLNEMIKDVLLRHPRNF